MTERKYGWSPSLPDIRDHKFKVQRAVRLPAEVDLRPRCPPVYDQGELGSCTAHAAAAAFDFERMEAGDPPMSPSRLFIYYAERVLDGSVNEDAGSYLRSAAKVMNKTGVCNETLWPYVPIKFAVKPTANCYNAAAKCKVVGYAAVDNTNLTALRQCLAQGSTMIFGFSVYESFESDRVARTGNVPMPKKTEKMLGGHAVQLVGYKHKSKKFIVRNSWGTDWGDGGYCYMPYAYLTNPDLADDFWQITAVTK